MKPMKSLPKSRVLEKLRAGEVVNTVKLNLADARVAEIAAMCGVDCVWLDMEHVPNTLHDIEHQVRAVKLNGADALVRVPRGSYSDLTYPLEMDATGIMVPHVMSAEDAKGIVWNTRCHPIGRRPLDGGNADGKYCTLPMAEYVKQANTERFVIAQIEDPEAMDELDAIAAVQGIDLLFFGPGDYSHAVGEPGNTNHPEVNKARELVVQAARRHGKYAGTMAPPGKLEAWIEMGYQFLNIGADIAGLVQHFQHVLKDFEDTVSRKPAAK